MFDKKVLLKFYLIGMPIFILWGFLASRGGNSNPLENRIWDYQEPGQSSQEFWMIVGAGAVWIAIAYVIYMIYKKFKSKH